MYKELISHLAFVYGFVCKGRGMMDKGDMEKISDGAHVMVKNAPAVMASGETSKQDARDLGECDKILEHIDEMIVYLNFTEIV